MTLSTRPNLCFWGINGVWNYPGGHANTFLHNMSEKSIEIDYGFSVNDGNNGKQVAYKQSRTPEHFGPVGTQSPRRSKLLSSLVEGTLVIEVCMKMAKPRYNICSVSSSSSAMISFFLFVPPFSKRKSNAPFLL